MSEFTKGKMKFTHGTSRGWWVKLWLDQQRIAAMQGICKDDAILIAKELVRRWNAFEDGGIVGEYVDVCEYVHTLLTENIGQSTHAIAKLEAILWPKAKPE